MDIEAVILGALSQAGLKDPQMQQEIMRSVLEGRGGQPMAAPPMPPAPAAGGSRYAVPPTKPPPPPDPMLGSIPADSALGRAVLSLRKPAAPQQGRPQQQRKAAPQKRKTAPAMSESDRLNMAELEKIRARRMLSGDSSVFGELY